MLDIPHDPVILDPADDDLVARVRRGEGAAFALIMRRHNRRLFRTVRAMLGNDAEAEEVVQETYARAFAALGGWREEASLATWLSRIALNEALSLLRQRHEAVPFDDAADSAKGGAFDHLVHPSPEAAAAHGEIRALIERAIDDLPPSFRIVFMLRAVEQLSVEETAIALEIAPETVRTRFFRARRLLRRALGQRVAGALQDSFPFAGARCERIMIRVLERFGLAARPAIEAAAAEEKRLR